MYKGLFCFLFTLLFYVNAKTQVTESDTISISDFVQEMVGFDTLKATPVPPGKPYSQRFSNKKIRFVDPEKDMLYWNVMDPNQAAINDSVTKASNYKINQLVEISKCEFHKNQILLFNHMVFNETVVINDVSDFAGEFKNCNFKGGLYILNSDISLIQFTNCKFNGLRFINNEADQLFITKCTFSDNQLSAQSTGSFSYESGRIQTPIKGKTQILIDDCDFPKRNNISEGDITPNVFTLGGGGRVKDVFLQKNDFSNQVFDFVGLKIEDNFYVDECEFGFPINVAGISLPQNTNFRWNEKLKLCVRDPSKMSKPSFYTEPYMGRGEKELIKQTLFDELISGYNMFFKMYKNRGDLESANACYVQMKSVQTRMLEYKYNKNKTLNNYFNLKINEFLAYFCDYGTNPAKSLIISMYIILYFSIFYFFFYSSWDKINRGFFIRKYKRLTDYLTSNKNLEDFYNEKKSEEIASFKNFKKQTLESKKNMPMLLHLLAWPLYKFSLLKFKVSQFIFRNSDVLKEEWQKQSRSKKIMKGGLIYLGVFIYLLSIVILRGINSIALSINTFSTLGFGDIPVTGISRYVAIIQGFIGWFLLSIFSVSLISQILQL